MQYITILGATGSIGVSTLDVLARHPEQYSVYALSAHGKVAELAAQCVRFRPQRAVVGTPEAAQELRRLLVEAGVATEVDHGVEALCAIASAPQVTSVMAAIVGCFVAIVALFKFHSPLYLLSVMALVWIADIGAYFSGKAFGKRKLAPSISPGKSWEGAIGGGIAVLVIAAITILAAPSAPWLQDTFAVQLQLRRGWPMALLVLLVLVAASIVGDLFESQLKRRAGIKDSSNLLPGHGGVLDRIDALIPVLPFAALVGSWL